MRVIIVGRGEGERRVCKWSEGGRCEKGLENRSTAMHFFQNDIFVETEANENSPQQILKIVILNEISKEISRLTFL